MGSMVRNTSFSVYAGQITGMFGLIGSGRTETAKIVAGVAQARLLPWRRGAARTTARCATACRARRSSDGIVYVTEDRKVEGFFETMSIAENLHMGKLAWRLEKNVVLRMADMRTLAEQWTSDARHPRHRQQRAGDRAVRRQPAEGGDRQIAGAEAADRSSSTSRPAASTSAPSPRSTS